MAINDIIRINKHPCKVKEVYGKFGEGDNAIAIEIARFVKYNGSDYDGDPVVLLTDNANTWELADNDDDAHNADTWRVLVKHNVNIDTLIDHIRELNTFIGDCYAEWWNKAQKTMAAQDRAHQIAMATLNMDEESTARYAADEVWGEGAADKIIPAAVKAAEASAETWADQLRNDGCEDDAETIIERARVSGVESWEYGVIKDLVSDALGVSVIYDDGEDVQVALIAVHKFIEAREEEAFPRFWDEETA